MSAGVLETTPLGYRGTTIYVIERTVEEPGLEMVRIRKAFGFDVRGILSGLSSTF